MALRSLRVAMQTMTAATDTFTTANIIGKIKKITIISSASNTFKAYSLRDDNETADEYIIGAAGSTVTVNGITHYYPVIDANKISDGTAYEEGSSKTATRVPVIINGPIKIDVASGTSADTWQVVIWYELSR